jgi:hypothetical protein
VDVWGVLAQAVASYAEELVFRLWGVKRSYQRYLNNFEKFVFRAVSNNVDPLHAIEVILRNFSSRKKNPPFPGQYGGKWIWKFYGHGIMLIGYGIGEKKKRIDVSLDNTYKFILKKQLSDEEFEKWLRVAPRSVWDYLLSDPRIAKYLKTGSVKREMLEILSSYVKEGLYDYLLERRRYYDELYGYGGRK